MLTCTTSPKSLVTNGKGPDPLHIPYFNSLRNRKTCKKRGRVIQNHALSTISHRTGSRLYFVLFGLYLATQTAPKSSVGTARGDLGASLASNRSPLEPIWPSKAAFQVPDAIPGAHFEALKHLESPKTVSRRLQEGFPSLRYCQTKNNFLRQTVTKNNLAGDRKDQPENKTPCTPTI